MTTHGSADLIIVGAGHGGAQAAHRPCGNKAMPVRS